MESIESMVRKTLEEDIRPRVQMDGGDVEFVRLDEQKNVFVKLGGACIGCLSATLTLKLGIEDYLRSLYPELGEVIQVEEL